jgi:uncharacterized protein
VARTKLEISESAGGCRFRVYLQPRASRDEIVGSHKGALKIRLTSPALENRANRHLVEFLAQRLGVAKSCVAIASGQRSRSKTVVVSGLSGARCLDLLALHLVD